MTKLESSNSPVSQQGNVSNLNTSAQAPNDGAGQDLSPASWNGGAQVLSPRSPPYNQISSVMDDAPREHRELAPLRTTAGSYDPVDDESSSKARMWDPVKDCGDPNTTQPSVIRSPSSRQHSSASFMHSAVSRFTSGDVHSSPYGQAEDSRQELANLGTRGTASTGLTPNHQMHRKPSEYQDCASVA